MPMAAFQVKLLFLQSCISEDLLYDTNVVSTMLNVISAQYDCNKDNLVPVLCLSCLGSVAGLGAASLTSEADGRDVRLKQLVLRFLCAKHITLTK
jgi:hypothetical protein